MRRVPVALGACLILSACSALVSPDPGRLGRPGGGGTDAGAADATSPDAFTPMGCTGGCDDGIGCTHDSCASLPAGSRCEHMTDDALCGPTEQCTLAGCMPRMCAGPEICGNGVDDDCNPSTPDPCGTMLPDDCASVQAVDLSSGSAVVRGSFDGLHADYATYCIDEGRRAGRDAVYRIDLGMRVTDLRIETVGEVDTVLSVSAECGTFVYPTCNDDQRPGVDDNARVFLHPTAGTIYVLVSAFDADGGPYEVRFTTSPIAPNECGDGSLDVTQGGTVVGVAFPPSRASGACMPVGTRMALESVMHFDGADIDRLRLFAGFPAFLYARSSCDPTSELVCDVGVSVGASGSIAETGVGSDARRVHLFVDGASRSDQVFALFVEP